MHPSSETDAGKAPPAQPSKPPTLTRRSLLVGVVAVLSGTGGVAVWRTQSNAPAQPATVTETVKLGNLTVAVESSGTLQPLRSQPLVATQAGELASLLVQAGDRVSAGQLLASMAGDSLRRALESAEIVEQLARIKVSTAREGEATPDELASAQAAVASAEAQLARVRTGDVTASDIRRAQAQLTAAESRLAALRNPSAASLSSAETRLAQAMADLQTTRDSASQAKTSAEAQMQQAAGALTQAQSAYATAVYNWEYVQSSGNDPIQPELAGANGTSQPNTLSDGQRQQYYDAFVRAEAALHSAERALEQAKVAYDTARSKEAVDMGLAEQQLRDAQTQLNALRNPAPADQRQAEASVADARAQLENLRAGGTPEAIAAAQAELDRAQAALAALTGPSAPSLIEQAELELRKAELDLEQARADLSAAELHAPFDGVVSAVAAGVGDHLSAGTEVLAIVDLSELDLELSLSEYDIQQVAAGQTASISFETLAEHTFSGKVVSVALAGEKQGNLTTYAVAVRFVPGDVSLKLGMTGDVSIAVAVHENVLQVPNRALQGEGDLRVVRHRKPGAATFEPLAVRVGLSNDTMTEVLGCAEEGKACLAEGDELEIELPQMQANGQPGGSNFMMAGPASGPGQKIEIVKGP